MSDQPPRKNIVDGYKYCPKCDCFKPVTAFFTHSQRGDGRQACCKSCRPVGRDSRAEFLSREYHLTPESYNRLAQEQDGKCAICGAPPRAYRDGGPAVFHVDHNHKTGAVRGLLCPRCNARVGAIERRLPKMPQDILECALVYLAVGRCSVWDEAIEIHRPDEDVVQRFLTDCCENRQSSEIRANVLYDAFVQWCADEGEIVRSQTRLGSVLAQKGYQKRRSQGIRWLGIALKDPEGQTAQITA